MCGIRVPTRYSRKTGWARVPGPYEKMPIYTFIDFFFHIFTLSSDNRCVIKKRGAKNKNIFLFKFDNFISNISLNILLRSWKIKFTECK